MKIAIIGYGKMGKTIESMALNKGYDIVLRISDQNLSELTSENLQKSDVAIEFSRPEAAFDNIKACLEAGIPVVSGTTGWLEKMPEVHKLVDKHQGTFFYASNFSIGVNIFFALNRQLAKMMNDWETYSASIHEIHHTQKLDAPSGTAITLGKGVLENIERLKTWKAGEETANHSVLPITSDRVDNTPGTHIIKYESEVDEIEIKHLAKSRAGFAQGALMAAKWVVGKKGVLGMSDILGF